jgi:hypothetical protein
MPFPALIAAAMGLACLACTSQRAATPEAIPPAGSAASIRVTDLTLGAAVGLDKKVREPKDVFAPDDTVYVSVVTEGRSSDTMLGARWRQGETVLQEIEQAIAPDGAATSEFHVSKPGGFARGEYQVEILVEGRPVQGRRFTVK